jgi:hypothetical protein
VILCPEDDDSGDEKNENTSGRQEKIVHGDSTFFCAEVFASRG